MKFILRLLVPFVIAGTFFSCSNDDNGSDSEDFLFSPPEFLYGTWRQEVDNGDGTILYVEFIIEEHNIIESTNWFSGNDLMVNYDTFFDTVKYDIVEVSDDDSYELIITNKDDSFEMISDLVWIPFNRSIFLNNPNEITLQHSGFSNAVLTKQ